MILGSNNFGDNNMRFKIVPLFLFVIFIAECASLKANRDMGVKISKSENKIMVFPLRNPYYNGVE